MSGLVLGIESSCDETAASVVDAEGVVRASVIASQVEIHARHGGVVPELASRNHLVAMGPTITAALAEAGVAATDLSAIAVTTGPGLAGCLLVGLQAAKALAWSLGVPLVPVHHILAHVHAPFLKDGAWDGAPGLRYPHVALAVSGGHTSLMRVEAPGVAKTLGGTLDDAAGEAFDKLAKLMGLPYPGGVHIDRLAEAFAGTADEVPLPRPLRGKGLDFSFSGLKTAARQRWEALPEGARDETARGQLAAAAQAAIVDVLVEKTIAACRAEGLRQVVVAGGVACNSGLRRAIAEAARRGRLEAFVTPARWCSDNAAMVAGLGQALLARGGGLTGAALLAADIFVTSRTETHGGLA
jgi:N6-L-threonylcarbamoyladenine synthase